MVIFLPAGHFLFFAFRSSTSTVLVCTAIFLPHALSGETFFGLPFFDAHQIPAEK